jgi:signal transduction histidine kinase/CheY-like chemotaxis protein
VVSELTRPAKANFLGLSEYKIAIASVGLALAARLALDPLIGDREPFALFYLAVVVSTWLGGLRPGFLALALGFLAGVYFFVAPRFALMPVESGDLVALVTYLFVGCFIVAGTQSASGLVAGTSPTQSVLRHVWVHGLQAPRPVRYAFGIAVAVVASLIRIAFNPVWGESSPFIFYFPATLFTALLVGLGPALTGVAVCLVITVGWVIPPSGAWWSKNAVELAGLGVYVVVDVLIAWLGAAHRSLILESERQTAELKEREQDLGHMLAWLRTEEAAAQAARAEAESRLRDVQSLVDVNRELGGSLDLPDLLQGLCRLVRDMVGADGATFVVREGDHVRYVAEDAASPLWAGQSFPIASRISGWSILHGDTAVIEDVYSDPRIPVETYESTFVRSLAMVPVQRDGEFAGAIGTYWARPRRVAEREVALLEAVAATASVAIAKAQLFGEMRSARSEAERAAETTRRVQKVADAMLADLSLEDMLHEVLIRVRETLEADIAVMLVLESDRTLRVRGVVGAPDAEIGVIAPSGQGFCGLVAAERRAVVWKEVDPEQIVLPFLRRMGVHALAGVPVTSSGRLLGVLQVGSVRPGAFGDEETKLLQLAAERIALAMERVERRDAEQRVRESLDAANRAKDEFLAMLGHELRNPLSAVRNAVVTASLDESRRPQALEIARRQVDQLGRLIDDLLDVARITQGRVTLHKEPVNLAEIVERAVESTRSFTESRGVHLHVSLGPGTIRVDADPTRLEQVFVNLLSNAAKYSDAGGRVEVSIERLGDRVAVHVRDTGIGIAPEMLPRIFDLFAQADRSLDRAQGGLGIGLTVARRLVELHGGRIGVHSEGLGKGADFVVTLSVLPETAAAERPGEAAVSRTRQPARVLLVEDHPDSAETLTMLLQLLGHHVRSVKDGPAALDAVRADVPDVMIVDIGLPGMDGYEVARRVRQDPLHAKVLLVALTGYGSEEDKRRALAAGFDHHLVKPITPETLDALVARLEGGEPETRSTVQ